MAETETLETRLEQFGTAWNEGDLAILDELVADEFVGHMIGESYDLHGDDEYKGWVEQVQAAFPDLEIAFDPVFVFEDTICGMWTFVGTNEGDMPNYGIEATGAEVEFSGLFIDRFEGGRLVEMWHQVDNLTFMQQLGLVPELSAA